MKKLVILLCLSIATAAWAKTALPLKRIALFTSFDEARAQAVTIPVRTITPWVDELNGEKCLRIAEDHGYPVSWGKLTEAGG